MIAIVLLAVLLYAAAIGIGAAVLSWAWNLVIPSVFSGPTLEFAPAAGLIIVLIVLRSLIFGGVSVTAKR